MHQTPGGMISNLISQLKEQKALNKYDDALKETALVRKDLGYPPLVTPTSQIVGTQAVFNVMLGARYKIISKEVKDYIRGLYGRSPGPIDEALQKKAIGDETPIKVRPAESIAPEWDKSLEVVKALKQIEQPSDEDVLAYALFPLVAKEFWANPPAVTPPVSEGVSVNGSPTVTGQQQDTGNQNSSKASLVLELNNKKYSVKVTPSLSNDDKTILKVDVEGKPYEVKVSYTGKAVLKKPAMDVEAKPVAASGESRTDGREVKSVQTLAPDPVVESGVTNVTVPMPGKVVNIKVNQFDKVKRGEILFILEAMKMQNEICAPCDGTISDISIQVGDNVDNQSTVIKIRG